MGRKSLPIGTKRTRNGQSYIKTNNGWVMEKNVPLSDKGLEIMELGEDKYWRKQVGARFFCGIM